MWESFSCTFKESCRPRVANGHEWPTTFLKRAGKAFPHYISCRINFPRQNVRLYYCSGLEMLSSRENITNFSKIVAEGCKIAQKTPNLKVEPTCPYGARQKFQGKNRISNRFWNISILRFFEKCPSSLGLRPRENITLSAHFSHPFTRYIISNTLYQWDNNYSVKRQNNRRAAKKAPNM